MVDDLVSDGSEGDEAVVNRNVVRLSQTLDERWKLSGDLDPETGEVLDTALRLAASNDPEPDLTVPERLGDHDSPRPRWC